MILKDMFLKDIERDIRGVIKVAQTSEADIYQELDEYVVTQELHSHFSKFYDNYQKGIDGKTDKMGAWISGFFGSGKSHFLKILAYLLENNEVQGKKPVDFFESKIKDPIVFANMKRTAEVETETILFNIDSKSSLDNKSKEDAILRVFMKVFYEHRGYYGDVPGVAEMEKYLDKHGVYDLYKQEFEALAGESWETNRNSFYFAQDEVIGALTKVTNMSEESARNWFESGVDNFEISIEKFAKDVKEYIDEKGPNFHLVFLVDEIGQYIGENRNLMLNLQTLAEDLGTHAYGKAWIIVTSQESIDSIVNVKGDDFSRIQGRFDTRLSLSSISVDEVIKKRILEKHSYVNEKLMLLYPEKSAILKNLISFRETSADLRGYEDEIEFAEVYPFVPYQFKLLQNVFEQVRRHGSSGKHLSEGERSMLSAFKEAGLRYKDAEEGALIPFFAFYDTIKEFLNPSVSRVIEGAYENPALKDDSFNMDLLKVLFMIKYIKELPANIDNIATLMVTHIDEDKLELKEKIQASLRKLIGQTLIQKNGEHYFFLTDDEQDINREIKSIMVDEEILKRELANYIFQDLYDAKRFNHSRDYSFPFNQKMDEKNYGNQTSSIGIQILSPLSEHYHKSETELMIMATKEEELIVKLGGNESYVEELEEALRIEEYRKKRNISQLPENIQNILNNKASETRERKRRVRDLLESAIKDGTYFINGTKVDIRGSSVKEKFDNAFNQLVDNVYTKLGYIKEHIENDGQLKALIASNTEQLTLDDSIGTHPNELAIREVYDYIDLQEQLNKQVRVKLIYDRFRDKPFGWKQLDVAGLLVELLLNQRIRIRYNSENLDPEEDFNQLLTVLTKTSEIDKGIIVKRVQVDESLIRTAKRISREIFNTTDLSDDEDGLVKEISVLIKEQITEINSYKSRYEGRNYPGMSLLDKGLEYFEQFDNKLDNASFFMKLKELEDNFMDWEEDFNYVENFFDTNQKNIFDQGLDAINNYQEIKEYIQDKDVVYAIDDLKDIVKDPIPYGRIKDIPELVHQFNKQKEYVLEEVKTKVLEEVERDFNELLPRTQFFGVSKETKAQVEEYYKNLINEIDTLTDIFRVESKVSRSSTYKQKLIRLIAQEIEENQNKIDDDQPDIGSEQINTFTLQSIKKKSIKLSELVPVKSLSTEEDIDLYVGMLSKELKKIIKADSQIEIIE